MEVVLGPLPCKGCQAPMVLARVHGMLVLLDDVTRLPHRCRRLRVAA